MVDCPSFIGARVMRATRLDSCGRPVYGPDSVVTTRGLISVNIEPSVEEGETFTQRNINGDLCVNDQGEDTIQWYDVSIEFCQVDACLWQILNPAWKLVRNAHGEVTGLRMGQKIDNTRGFALELWPKISGEGSLCDDDAPEDADPHGYFLLPYTVGRAPDGFSFENGVTTFTLNGRTKRGALWGKGPYNVTYDADRNPVPLLEPISSGAGGEDPDHFHWDQTLLSPPEPLCGCQPLEPLTPTVEGGTITVDPVQTNRACFTVQGSAARQVRIDWGDGSEAVTSRVGREECHLYTAAGTYTVELCDIDAESGDADLCSTYTVEITEVPALPDPVISVTPASGDAPLPVTLTVDNHGNGDVTIDWGDGTAPTQHDGGTTEEPATYPHQYLAGRPEPYTITVTAVEDERATATTTVQVAADEPPVAPEASVDPAAGTAPVETTLTVNNHGRGDVVLDWGDGSDPEAVTGGDTGQEAVHTHTYTEPGEYTITVTDEADASLSGTATVTVDAPPPPVDPTNLAITDATASELGVSWEWAGNETDLSAFQVRHRTIPDGTWSTPEAAMVNDRSFIVTGLTASTEYEIGVTAVSTDGTSSAEVTTTGTTTAV
ncbi:fibronectin type III domain-containing protein [Nocardiopsis synnemataformans]|uniref:fibronectin type III domain-containing protein n=1 Tax=Nocardiopsis synnemataformans TaxID=61305 RepID=UPI003EBF24E0